MGHIHYTYARSAQKMADCLQLILSQILVSTNVNSLGAGAVCSGVPQRVFIFVCSLVFTPLIGYQVSLVDSLAIRRLSHGRRYFR